MKLVTTMSRKNFLDFPESFMNIGLKHQADLGNWSLWVWDQDEH